jgi:hypothetical protein
VTLQSILDPQRPTPRGHKAASLPVPVAFDQWAWKEQSFQPRWRCAVEPVIGHLKAEHRMGRNYLWLRRATPPTPRRRLSRSSRQLDIRQRDLAQSP